MKTIDIRTYSEQLLENLKKTIDQIFSETGDAFIKHSRSLYAVRSLVSELREFTYQYQFKGTDEEIDFFKNLKPTLLAQYFYYEALVVYSTNKPMADLESIKLYSDSILTEIRKYSNDHLNFYTYCASGESHLDQIYFTRNSTVFGDAELDIRFSTKYDVILSKLIAHQHVESYINDRIQSTPGISPLKWTSKKAHLVELIYALHRADAFNNGKAELKEIASTFERLFNVTLGNLYRQFQEISLRKINRTAFIDVLKVKLEERFDDLQ